MKNKTSKNNAVTSFTLTERHGGLPFIVMWIGLHKLPTIQHFGTLEEAKGQYNKLTELGREPALLLDINQTEHYINSLPSECQNGWENSDYCMERGKCKKCLK